MLTNGREMCYPSPGIIHDIEIGSLRYIMSTVVLEIKGGPDGKRIELNCEHQRGVLYVVPSEANWVCDEQLLQVHALAGFFEEISELDESSIKKLMQRWGIFYRKRPLDS